MPTTTTPVMLSISRDATFDAADTTFDAADSKFDAAARSS